MPAAHEKIGPTAHATAYAWHRLGMPYAQLFTTREGAAMYWSFAAATQLPASLFEFPTLLDYLEFRHRMIETQLRRLEPDRIIELGAGLSRRGLTWARDHGVPYVEIDLPHMSAAKRARVEAAPRAVRSVLDEGLLELRSTDILAPGFGEELRELVREAERPVVVSEGMLDYFSIPEREQLASNLARGLRARGGHYITDTQRADRERRVAPAAKLLRGAIRMVTRGQGAMRPFNNLDHIEHTFALAGFAEGRELKPRELASDEPRLGQLRSPTTIWLGRVAPES